MDAPKVQAPKIDVEKSKERELSWYAERVQRGRKEIFSEVATITPTIAKHMLDCNADNRKMNDMLVKNIASDIQNNRWDINGESIIVAKDGFLNDGQHRLSAIVEANKAARSIIVFGIDRNSRFTVDAGKSRTVGDYLGMEGATYTNNAASVARLHNFYRRGIYTHGIRGSRVPKTAITNQEIRGEYWQYQKDIDRAIHFITSRKFLRLNGVASSATAYMICAHKNLEAAEMFFERLETGTNLPQSSPILALRLRLMEMRQNRKFMNEKLETILRYWNAYRRKETIKRAIHLRKAYPDVIES